MSQCSIPCKCPKGLFLTLLPKWTKYPKVKFNILCKAFFRHDLKETHRKQCRLIVKGLWTKVRRDTQWLYISTSTITYIYLKCDSMFHLCLKMWDKENISRPHSHLLLENTHTVFHIISTHWHHIVALKTVFWMCAEKLWDTFYLFLKVICYPSSSELTLDAHRFPSV